MRNHANAKAFDVMATVMAYLIFAISLLAINMVKYQMIKVGFYSLLIISGALAIYSIHNFNKGLK